MKTIAQSAGIFLGIFLALPSTARSASSLDIGTDYRIRGISISKADYGNTPDQDYSYYSQRALAHVGGKFSPNIEFMTQFQAIGVAGSSAPISNPVVDPTGGRYPNTNFTPWVQSAYFKASHLYDTPIALTIGRQPITLGDGFILSDDDLGFTGIRAQSELPWYGLEADLFTFKTGDSLIGSADNDIYGIQLTKPAHALRYQLAMVTEQDNSGSTIFMRPSEYRFDTTKGFDANTDFTASHISRTFYDARVEGHLLQGGFYKAEFALQSGNVDRSSATLGSVQLGGYAFLVSGGLFTNFSKYGPIEFHGTFGIASGDSGGGKDDAFQPTYGHRFDGLERSGFGELYGATLYDAQPFGPYNTPTSSSSVSGLPPGYSGLRVIGAGVTAHPTALLSVGVDYYVYTAEESPGANFPVTSSDTSLGTEIDVGVGFAYTNYLSFRGSFALFSPGVAYQGQSNATRYLIEATGRF